MKGIRHNIKFLLWTFILLFTTLLGYFSYSMAINGTSWPRMRAAMLQKA